MTDFKIPASGDAAPDFCAARSRLEVKAAGQATLGPSAQQELA
ncbi:MAG: hypothetical protein Q7J24_14770 [Desulfomicrobium sp.]|nr:hypothetical protein [Desulfomicrobium sp.]